MDPANLSRRSKSYDATLAAANAYSMAKYNVPFNVAKASGDYKNATSGQTFNTMNFLNSLTGRDNASGNLGTVVAMSDKLSRTNFPPINRIDLWAKLASGNAQVAAYRSAILEVSDQVAKVLQGGGGNSTSDAKINQAMEVLDKNFNAEQMRATAVTLRELLGNRKKEMIGDNRYLQQWYGNQNQRPAAGAGSAQGLPGTGKSISLAAAQQLPQYKGKTAQ